MRPSRPLFLALFAIACSSEPTATHNPALKLDPMFSVSARNSDAPNVLVFQGEFASCIFDPVTDLVACAGLPDNPKSFIECVDGTEPFQTADFHLAGLNQRAIKALVSRKDINLHVYRFSTFEDICIQNPIAQGIGHVSYTDSDVFYTGGRNDAWGYRMEGTVTLTSGGTAHLLAHNRWQILPDGTLRRIFRHVNLLGG